MSPARRKHMKAVCRAKFRYANQQRAERAAEWTRLRTYRCPICRHFHLTSKEQA